MGLETQLADARLANTTLRDKLRRTIEERDALLEDRGCKIFMCEAWRRKVETQASINKNLTAENERLKMIIERLTLTARQREE